MPRWAALFGLALWLCSTARADAPPDASLSWVRIAGAETCVGAHELAAEVERLVAHPVWVSTSEADLSVEGYVAPTDDGRFKAELMTAKPDGTIVGRREVLSQSADCSRFTASIALVVSLSVDPESGFVPLPGVFDTDADEHMDSLLSGLPAPAAAEAVPNDASAAAQAGRSDSDGKVRKPDPLGTELNRIEPRKRGILLAGAGGLGQVPKGSGGLVLGMLGTRESWPVGMEGRLWMPRWEPDRQASERYLFWQAQLALYACPVWRARPSGRLEGHLCLGLAPNLSIVRSAAGERTSRGGFDAELALHAVASTGQKYSIFLGFTLGAMIYGQTYEWHQGDNARSWRTPYVRGLISAGLFFAR